MAKYLKNYLTVSAATEAQDILSPNVTYIQDREKLLMADVGDDKSLQIVLDGQGNPKIEEKRERDYLTFTCIEDGSISTTNYAGNTPNIEYSKNGGEWTSWDYTNIDLKAGDIVKMKGDNPNGFSLGNSEYSKFVISTGKIAASGNIMSLIDGLPDGTKVIPCEYCFCYLFQGCTSLTTAPELPVTTLTRSCYNGMFQGCTSLTTAPELPATTLARGCYISMFAHCPITSAPALPATTLIIKCYANMFNGCTGLTTAPELPATTLASNCYNFMFLNCSSLNYIKCLATDISADSCTLGWVTGVAASGQFVCPNSMRDSWDAKSSVDGKPSGWEYVDA